MTTKCPQTRRHDTIVWIDARRRDRIRRPCLVTTWEGAFADQPQGVDHWWAPWSPAQARATAEGEPGPDAILHYFNLYCTEEAALVLLSLGVDQWEAKLLSELLSLLLAAQRAGTRRPAHERPNLRRLVCWREQEDGLAVSVDCEERPYSYTVLCVVRPDIKGTDHLCIVAAWPGGFDDRPATTRKGSLD